MTHLVDSAFSGLVAATFTPLDRFGEVDLPAIRPMVDALLAEGIAGLYVLGSTGEGPSLSFDERTAAAEAFVSATAQRVPVIVQVGSESLRQAQALAAHAQKIGASAISAVSPVYFRPSDLNLLVASMADVAAAAPDLPFYYYHIPAVTGVTVPMPEFLKLGSREIPTLQGIKFTSPRVDEFQACVEAHDGRFQMFWGTDEMLLAGLAAGARAAVGSTYNFAAAVSLRVLKAFTQGDWQAAQQAQSQTQRLVRAFVPFGPRAAQKAIMALVGRDCGPCRLPTATLTSQQAAGLRAELEAIGFFDWRV